MIGELITAGAGLLGSLFGGKKKSEKQTTKTVTENVSRVDYVNMRDRALTAGFNPLTALRNGGAAGFTSSTGTSNSTTTTPTTSQLPGALASVGGVLGQAFAGKLDPLQAKKRQLDTALVDYQLKQLNNGGPGALYPGSTYTGTKLSRQLMPALGPSYSKVASSPAARRPVQGPNKPGEGTIVGGDNPAVSSLGWNDGKYGYFHAPWMPDAETGENIYGDNEIFSTLYGGAKIVNDVGYTIWRNGRTAYDDVAPPIKKWMKRNAAKAPATAAQRASGRTAPMMRPRRPDGSF
ncbi:hypothetical protein HFO55_12990 [Rhizobium leguminosarum]|uniref:hypothetical protein n=1 Tax=Rhizobium leguminosarum TaxID=384 RepID=UPI001C97BE60|nr:hypothetical protein [Rhizobium leguminosarum]MBY5568147.1 hypothetical protein [Rhizobium leguminosarum]MBY5568153.1 hypothetical protein [Rhizobium leguminosarum]MBY5575282.1 hypothetical protein [Rhizobium leguminosarum]MBY5575288.1 hypothetical protein [Rhizobium leguminosarum]